MNFHYLTPVSAPQKHLICQTCHYLTHLYLLQLENFNPRAFVKNNK